MEKLSKSDVVAISNLPPLPRIVQRLQELQRKDQIDRNNIVKEVSNDPAIITEIIKVAKSPFYNVKNDNLGFIVTFLGFNEIFKIVFAISIVSTLTAQDKIFQKYFWEHSYATALWAEILGKKLDLDEEFIDQLWVPAMLHDIGKMVLMIINTKKFIEYFKKQKEKKCLFSEVDNGESMLLGYYLGIFWNLPLVITNTIGNNSLETIKKVKTRTVSEVVALANLFANLQYRQFNKKTFKKIVKKIHENLDWDINQIKAEIEANEKGITEKINSLL